MNEYLNPISNKRETEDTIIKNIDIDIEFFTKGRRSKLVIFKKIMADCTLYYIFYRKYMLCISSVFEHNNSIYLRNLYIKPEYRKQGIANKLLMNLFFDLYNNGIYRVEVEPFESTIDYLRKWGFSYIDNSNKRMYLDLHNLSEIKELKSYNDYPRIYLLAKRLEGN